MVPADSQQIPRARCYSGHSQPKKLMFSRTGLSPSTAGHSKPLPLTPTTRRQADRPTTQDPTTPHMQPLSGITHMKFSQKSDFARRYSRNHNCFLLLRVLRCFTSPRSLHTSYFIHQRVTAHNHGRVSPFGHPRINAQLATPRGITQPLTSFIGSLCQGIHRAPFTDNTKTFIKMTRDHKHDQKLHTIKKILASTIQFSNNTTRQTTPTPKPPDRQPDTNVTVQFQEHAAPDTQMQQTKHNSAAHHKTV